MLNIAVIGSGWVVSNRHIPSLSRFPEVTITTIVGRQLTKLSSLAQKFGIKSIIEGDAIEHADIWLDHCDAVVIGTNPQSHFKLAQFCLEHGKHVLMEKPMTLNIKDSKALVTLAQKNNLTFAIVQNFQFADCSITLDKDLQKGKLGDIQNILAFQNSNPNRRLPSWYEDLPYGLFYDESPHLLYLIDKYAPGSKIINSTIILSTHGLQTPALVNTQFVSKSGVPVNLSLNFESRLSEWFFAIYGDKGTGIIDIFRDTYIFLPNDGEHKPLDIVRTSWAVITQHLWGTLQETIKVLTKRALFGNQTVHKLFIDAILHGKDLGPIDAKKALETNLLQWEIINKSVVTTKPN